MYQIPHLSFPHINCVLTEQTIQTEVETIQEG